MSPTFELVDHVTHSTFTRAPRRQSSIKNKNNCHLLGESNGLIRTGCIPCLHDGLKCDGSNPRCLRRAVSEEWRINDHLTGSGEGTWRERRGLHIFVNFAMSPERCGLYESPFWHGTVMQSCFQHDAVRHVASAIGALQEHFLKPGDNSGMAFALRQCNRSISLLTASSEGGNGSTADPGVALITCLLFTVFEALMGHQAQAITHSAQSRRLLENCERLAAMGQRSQLLDTNLVLPVIYALERQAKAIQGRYMRDTDTTNDPPLPDVSTIHSLEHANWTLYFAWMMLTIFCQDTTLESSRAKLCARIAEKEAMFAPWLKTWEQSFSEYLFRESQNLSTVDMQRARVLKANHIAANIIANMAIGRFGGWPGFYTECKAIIDLATSVLNSYAVHSVSELPTLHFPFLKFGLWICEPLFIVMARCPDSDLRREAASILNRLTRLKKTRYRARRARSLIPNDSRLEAPTDTDTWTVDEWLDFTSNVRLDTAMATYFGRLPSEYIEQPVFPAKSERCYEG